ncbi:type II toxin-antitoxin system RatA family toxin [Aquisalinus flavus]|uniref:Ubiquinone-binding protein n=1 Tax=Aquisalinus flavus TaxID=1526572 RepID=A0A8J2V5L3_9PROT|nr:type II toxin-antitoxin system RatA family toxin [Aquisalinus flavus]MBD0427763.1 type II toxin-antitoxin system RatA family toxin [Aquisalinus flavus]UNE47537.1 type II toxin-antitoxin system RatA family toxin [Aquisalinus flavus]GGD03641.1 ubiquinone-binding protein [Aquisalinus flavus]
MPSHHDRRKVPYSPDQMFDLVADVEDYPEFIPWCEGIRLRSDNAENGQGELIADMIVRYKIFRERFRSKVNLDRENHSITVDYIEGPFRKLVNIWHFEPQENGGCIVDFRIEFEFKNILLQTAAMQVFDKAFKYMSDAFISRAAELYPGKSLKQEV